MKKTIAVFFAVICTLVLTSSTVLVASDENPTQEFVKTEELGSVIEARSGGSEVLDLNACVKKALDSNDTLKAEKLRMEELDGQMYQALATGLPTLDLVGNWRDSRDPSFALDPLFAENFGFSPGDIESQSYFTTSLNLEWTINPLKISGAIGAAKLGIKRQEMATKSVGHQTSEDVITVYFNIVKVAEEIQAIRAQLANQSELLEIMKMRYELGMATRLDTLQAAVTLANVRPQLQVAAARLRNEGSRLNALMGQAPQTPLSIVNESFVEYADLNQDVALEYAWQGPDLVASDLYTDILRRNRRAQIADNRPYLTLNGAYGYVGQEFDSVFEDGHDKWSAAVAINVPIFDGLLTRGLVNETEAKIRRNEAELTGQRRQVQVEVMELLANLEMAHGVLAAALLNMESSEYVLEESLLMLELGKIDYVDVLVSESNRVEARRNVIDARYEVLVTTASLKRAIGWSPLTPVNEIPGLAMEVSK